MKKTMLFAASAAVCAAFAADINNAWVKGVTDKDPVSYKSGENMKFTLTLENVKGNFAPNEWFLDWKRSGDDGVIDSGREPIASGKPFVYTTKIAKPGFVRLEAYVVDGKGKRFTKKFTGDATTPEGRKAMNAFERSKKSVFFDGGAGADVDFLRVEGEPADWEEFWAKQAKRLELVPMKAELKEIKLGNSDVRGYAVRVDCAGLRPVTGYLTVPKAVDQGKLFPARLETHGYSGDSCMHAAPSWGRNNEIVLNINAHGLKLKEFGATDADTKALRWETRSHDRSYAFDPLQNADPEVAYFNGMVLRVKRALQYLKTVKGWNGKDLIASGGSQGGLQTIWAAGCGEGVTRAESGITWCCDMIVSGGDRLDRSKQLAADGWYIPWTKALGYYDAAIFGRHIPKTCTTIITRAGPGDYCCPPTGLAKLYNGMTCPKQINWMQGSEHGYCPPGYEGRDFVRKAK